VALLKIVRSIFVAGVALVFGNAAAFGGDFDDFREDLETHLPEGWSCQAVGESDGTKSFGLENGPSRYAITFQVRKRISQAEWEARYRRSLKAVKALFSDGENREKQRLLDDIEAGMELPHGGYKRIAIQISLTAPENVYPEMASDGQDAEAVYQISLGLLTPYRSPETKSSSPGGEE